MQMGTALEGGFPARGVRPGRPGLLVHQFQGTPAPGIAGAGSGPVLGQAGDGIQGDAGVKAAVTAAEDVDPPGLGRRLGGRESCAGSHDPLLHKMSKKAPKGLFRSEGTVYSTEMGISVV